MCFKDMPDGAGGPGPWPVETDPLMPSCEGRSPAMAVIEIYHKYAAIWTKHVKGYCDGIRV